MGTEVYKSFINLEEELEKAKNNLKGLNENIRKIIGRDPPDTRNDRKRGYVDAQTRRNDYNNGSERQQRYTEESPPQKRRQMETKSVFSRLSGPARDEEEVFKPKLHSRVIRELPTRQEIVQAQGVDAQSRARNRRIFGSLLGTLQKFCQEESRLKPKEDKKAQIERKLEEQQTQERENLKRERQNLFTNRKKQQLEIRMIEIKMNRMKEQNEWEDSKKPLFNFIMTKAKPHLYYLPKHHNSCTEQKLKESRENLEKMIEKNRQSLQDEILSIESRYKKDFKTDNSLANVGERIKAKHERGFEDDDEERDSSYNSSDGENDKEINTEHNHNNESVAAIHIEDDEYTTELNEEHKTERNVNINNVNNKNQANDENEATSSNEDKQLLVNKVL